MIDSESLIGNFWYISSVTYGMNGWSNFRMSVRVSKSTVLVVSVIFDLVNSMYQSQKSSQIKLYSSFPTLWNSYLSMFLITFLISWFFLVKIHLSYRVNSSSLIVLFFRSSMFIRTKREAFQSLFMKFHDDLTLSSSYLKSIPGAEFVVRK